MDIGEFLNKNQSKELLRFSTAGSVDDGKSTLIGRLLHDSKGIYEDQLDSIKRLSGKINNDVSIDFSLVTDGLKAEREQGITIDVAYRYFSTPKRKFIIADTPGHEQYTRKKATGASTANLAIILIDARTGVITQSKRHSFISSLLRIPHLVIAVNKMDLVEYSKDVFERIKSDYIEFAAKLQITDLHFIPISALHGDNVVDRSGNMPWYSGAPLLEYLEEVYIASDRNLIDFRFPVQYVIRPHLDFRGFSGQICSGIIRKGEEVMVLPSNKTTRIKSIVTYEGEIDYAFAPQSVNITLEDEVDISRGNMLVHPHNHPNIQRHFEAMVVWMSETPLDPARQYLVKHAAQTVPARIDQIRYKVNVNTLHKESASGLNINEIGRVVFTSKRPLFFDPYARNRTTGSFIIIDMISNNTVAAGMILDREPESKLPVNMLPLSGKKTSARTELRSLVSEDERIGKFKQKPVTLWLTGLVSSGKREISTALERRLFEMGATCMVLEGSSLRERLDNELDYSLADCSEHLRRVAEISCLLNKNGLITICSFVSPYESIRKQVSEIIGSGRFIEIFADASLEFCRKRDKTGLYEKADRGDIENLAGISYPYEPPKSPQIHLKTDEISVEDAVNRIIEYIADKKIFPLN
ncbi:MAG: sulfate adenylyltransferase subunit CysN [Lentisphaerae bacterium]|nr:sulfate adenylyltransferase subunit CysN [Lentisphaerota bacterium]